jgi:uncharacterized protein YndB with AHSA1/START domain
MEVGKVARASIDIKAKPEELWRALIDPAMIKRYLFGTEASSDWKVGSAISYRGTWEGKAYEDKGRILELAPGRLFKSTYWSGLSGKPDLPENYATVTYELAPTAIGTRISVAQDNNPSEEAKAQAEGNWRTVLGALKELLEG